jgi:pimeloyl-ACP methyl ester carboxylesterase
MMDFRWPPPPEGRPGQPPVSRGPRGGRPTLPSLPTDQVATPHGVELECLTSGAGEPVTVFAHGLGQGIAETRPLGSGVAGRKVYLHFRGHGRSASPGGRWTYRELARDLRAVADLEGATRALGVSLGAGALAALIADHPTRFDRVVFFLPAALTGPAPPAGRARLGALLAAAEAQDAAALADAISPELPGSVRGTPAGWSYLRQRIDQIVHFGLGAGLAGLADDAPVPDPTTLAAVPAPALVIGCRNDDLHPVAVAEALAAALPNGRLHVYDRPGILWHERVDLRERIASFLND